MPPRSALVFHACDHFCPFCPLCLLINFVFVVFQSLLHFLFERAPTTSGIFRKPANKKAVDELREKIDGGEDVSMEDANPIVIASLLKEYLRSLPDCLLLHELYPMWLETVEQENEVERFKFTEQ